MYEATTLYQESNFNNTNSSDELVILYVYCMTHIVIMREINFIARDRSDLMAILLKICISLYFHHYFNKYSPSVNDLEILKSV